MFYDRSGKPIDLFTWGGMFIDFESRVIKRDHVEDDEILTVWLGLDVYGTGPPTIFSSVIHNGRHGLHETRSATEADALIAHSNLLDLATRMAKRRNDKTLRAQTYIRMLEQQAAQWRQRVGDAAYEQALQHWRDRLAEPRGRVEPD